MAFDRQRIETYAAGADALRKATAGLTREQYLKRPIPETWSIQEIVIHLCDSDLIAADRMKRIAAEKLPLLIGYDQDAWIKELSPNDQSADDAVELLALNRKQTAAVLRKLPDAAFEKAGIHNERGKVTLAEMIDLYIWHLNHHLEFLLKKRAMV